MRRFVWVLLFVMTLALTTATQASAGPAAPPGAPGNVTQIKTFDARGQMYVELMWQPPAFDGGSPITGYEVYADHGSGNYAHLGTTAETHFGIHLAYLDWPLIAGVLAVRAMSGSEYGPGAYPTTFNDGQLASAAQGVIVTPGISALTIAWNAASPGTYPVAQYQAVAMSESGLDSVCSTSATTCTIENLVNGQPYSVKVLAIDDKGLLGESSIVPGSTVVGLVPKPPEAVSAVSKLNKVKVVWKPPASDGGLPISGYRVQPSKGSATCETKGLSCTMTLDYGSTYTFTVKAVNAKGESVASPPSKPITTQKRQKAPVKAPKRIRAAGTTVLLDHRLKTNAGHKVHVAVTVIPRGSKHATVATTPGGKTTITIKGHHRLRVTLRLWAPGSKTYAPYRYVKTWKVKG